MRAVPAAVRLVGAGTQECLSRPRRVARRRASQFLAGQLRPLLADGRPVWGRAGAHRVAGGLADAEMAPAWPVPAGSERDPGASRDCRGADPGGIGGPGLAGAAGTW
jgi:hypothetical protein